jgi:hypothetical protein
MIALSQRMGRRNWEYFQKALLLHMKYNSVIWRLDNLVLPRLNKIYVIRSREATKFSFKKKDNGQIEDQME